MRTLFFLFFAFLTVTATAATKSIKVDVFSSTSTDTLNGVNEIDTTGLAVGSVAEFLGRESIGDGGGGRVKWDGAAWVGFGLDASFPAGPYSEGQKHLNAATGERKIFTGGAWSIDWPAYPNLSFDAPQALTVAQKHQLAANWPEATTRSLSLPMIDLTKEAIVFLPDDFIALNGALQGGGTTQEIIHASVILTPRPFGPDGHRYYSYTTPYPEGNDQEENPVLMSSADGVNWVTPSGVTNPVENTPVGADYNADTHLMWDGDKLVMIHTQTSFPSNYLIRLCEVTENEDNTLSVSAIRTIIDAPLSFAGSAVSPSIDRTWQGNKYGLWACDVSGGSGQAWKMTYRESDALDGPWSAPIDCTITGLPDTHRPWHPEVKSVDGGYVLTLSAQPSRNFDDSADTGYGVAVELYMGTSSDGINFNLQKTPVCGPTGDVSNFAVSPLHMTGIYRCSFIPAPSGVKLGEMWITSYSIRATGSGIIPRLSRGIVEISEAYMPEPDFELDKRGLTLSGTDVTEAEAATYGGSIAKTAFFNTPTVSAEGNLLLEDAGVYWTEATSKTGVTFSASFVITKDWVSSVNSEFLFRVNSIGLFRRADMFQLGHWDGSAYSRTASSQYRVQVGDTVHIVMTDREGESFGAIIENRFVHTSSETGFIPQSNSIISIGNNVSAYSLPLGMELKHFAKWDRSMSDREMKQVYEYLKLRDQ